MFTGTGRRKAQKLEVISNPLEGGAKAWWHLQQDGRKEPERGWDILLHLQRWPQGGGRGTQERR